MVDRRQKSKAEKRRRWRWNVYIGFLISVLCIYGLFHAVEWTEVVHLVRTVDPLPLLAAFATMACGYVLRAWRWPFFFGERPPHFYDSFRCLIMGFFMNNILPARIGELVRAHLGGKATQMSRAYVLATVAGERLADGLAISGIFAFFFLLEAGTGSLGQGREILFVAVLFALAGAFTAVLLFFRQRVFAFLGYLGRVMPGHLSQYTLVRIRRFIEGLEPMLSPRRLVVLIILSMGVWFIELGAYYLVTQAFDYPMSIGGLALFLAAVNFSSLIPAAPGGIGVIEAFSTVALEQIGVDRETAFSMIAAQHVIQILVVGLPGLYFFFRMGARIPEPGEEAESEEEAELAHQKFVDISEPRPVGSEVDSVDRLMGQLAGEGLNSERNIELSVVIPAFNEEDRLPKTLLSIVQYLDARGLSYEIIVVDDGSSDGTSEEVRKLRSLTSHVRLLVNPVNRGKGYSVRFGVLNARGRLVLYSDADLSTPIEEVERLEKAIEAGAQVAIGSRALFSRDTSVNTVWYRKLMGRVFNGVVNLVVLPGIADTQCGFKLFSRPVARHIFSHQRADRFSFDVEVLFLARKAGCRIAEVPVNWTNVSGSKVNLVSDSAAMFRDVLKFRFKDFAGAYGTADAQKDKLRRREANDPV